MSIQLLKKLPTPTEIKADYPVTQKVAQIKAERDEMIRKVFTGESDKFLVIIGPCSADNEEAVCEYINRLSGYGKEVAISDPDSENLYKQTENNRRGLQRDPSSAGSGEETGSAAWSDRYP